MKSDVKIPKVTGSMKYKLEEMIRENTRISQRYDELIKFFETTGIEFSKLVGEDMAQINLHIAVYSRGCQLMRPHESWSAFIERLMDVFVESKAEMDDGR